METEQCKHYKQMFSKGQRHSLCWDTSFIKNFLNVIPLKQSKRVIFNYLQDSDFVHCRLMSMNKKSNYPLASVFKK